MSEIFRVRPIAVMQPLPGSGIPDGEDLIAYCARVSNPNNQSNFDTAAGLLDYCRRNAHWSVFEMGGTFRVKSFATAASTSKSSASVTATSSHSWRVRYGGNTQPTASPA